MIKISERYGMIILYTIGNDKLPNQFQQKPKLWFYSLNGNLISCIELKSKINDMILTHLGLNRNAMQLLITCDLNGNIHFRSLFHKFEIIHTIKIDYVIEQKTTLTSIALIPSEEALFCGCLDGSLLLLPLPTLETNGDHINIPKINSIDVVGGFSNFKNKTISKIDQLNSITTKSRGMVSEVSEVFSSFFS